MKCGFIGLGAMGLPMAANLAKAGLLHAVWARKAQAVVELQQQLLQAGLPACADVASPAELAQCCDVLVLCVSADADVQQTVQAMLPVLKAGQLLIDCSTVSPATEQALAMTLQERGVSYLDAPVSGGVEGAKAGSLMIMVGGQAADLHQAKPVLDGMGSRICHMGEVGAGQATKMVNQVVIAGINQAVSDGLELARRLELNAQDVIDLVGNGAAGSWHMCNRGPMMVAGEYPAGFKLRLHDKDLAIAAQIAEQHELKLPAVELTRLHYQKLMELGYGEEDISALYRLKCHDF